MRTQAPIKCGFGSQCKDTTIFGSQHVIHNFCPNGQNVVNKRLATGHQKLLFCLPTFKDLQKGHGAPRSLGRLPRALIICFPGALIGSQDQEPWLVGSHGPLAAPKGPWAPSSAASAPLHIIGACAYPTCVSSKLFKFILLRCSVRMSLGICHKKFTVCRMLQISIAWCQDVAFIHSFPTMYGKLLLYLSFPKTDWNRF